MTSVLTMCAISAFLSATSELRLDSKFAYKYDLETDISVDSNQGDAADGAEVTLSGSLTLSPMAGIDAWYLQLASVKVAANGKKTEVLEKSEPLYVQDGAFYLKDSHNSKESFLTNVLKSVANLFQHQLNTLGSCSVTTEDIVDDGKTVLIKTNCSADKELNKHSNHPLGIVAKVQRESTYIVKADKTIEEITSLDIIEYCLGGNKETQSKITSNLRLKFVSKEAKSGGDDQKKNLKKLDDVLYKFSRCDDNHCSKVSGNENGLKL